MRLRSVVEIGILAVFLITVLVSLLWYNTTVPADEENGISAEEYLQSADQLYAAGKAKFNAAAVKYWEAIKRDPTMVDAQFKLASIYYEKGWNHQPLLLLKEVERIDPEYPGLYLLIGKIYDEMQNTDKAFDAFQKAVAAQPNFPEARYYLGAAYQQKSMTEEAINQYKKATEESLTPNSPEAKVLESHLQLGRIYKLKGDYKEAEAELKAALNIDPASEEILSDLRNLYNRQARNYKKQREYGKAMEKYGKILKIDPNNPRNIDIYMELGSRYESDGLYDKAKEMYKAARKLDPMNFEIFRALKQIEILKDVSGEEGQDVNDQALKLPPSP